MLGIVQLLAAGSDMGTGDVSILVVEDEPLVRADMEAQLRKAGYRIAGGAASGKEAVEKARLLRPSLVLMDVTLRGSMDGFTAARLIEQERDVPVIVVSAQSNFENVPPCGRAHLSVDKPFTTEELLAAVRTALLSITAR